MTIIRSTNSELVKLSELDQMIDSIMRSKYPNENSILGDTLRYNLMKCYGINLNMFDSHKHIIYYPNGGICDTFYFYEAPMNYIKELREKLENPYDILGQYPEGTFLGFFATEFKDPVLRKQYQKEYIIFVYFAVIAIRKDVYGLMPFNQAYLNSIHMMNIIYILRAAFDFDFDIVKIIDELKLFKNTTFDKLIAAAINHKKEFMTATAGYNYADIMKFYRTYTADEYEEEYLNYRNRSHNMDSVEDSADNNISTDEEKKFKELHVFQYNPFEDDRFKDLPICIDHTTTVKRIFNGDNVIYTTQLDMYDLAESYGYHVIHHV